MNKTQLNTIDDFITDVLIDIEERYAFDETRVFDPEPVYEYRHPHMMGIPGFSPDVQVGYRLVTHNPDHVLEILLDTTDDFIVFLDDHLIHKRIKDLWRDVGARKLAKRMMQKRVTASSDDLLSKEERIRLFDYERAVRSALRNLLDNGNRINTKKAYDTVAAFQQDLKEMGFWYTEELDLVLKRIQEGEHYRAADLMDRWFEFKYAPQYRELTTQY